MNRGNARFEAWFAERCGLHVEDVAAMFNGQTYTSSNYHVELAWAAWLEALLGGWRRP